MKKTLKSLTVLVVVLLTSQAFACDVKNPYASIEEIRKKEVIVYNQGFKDDLADYRDNYHDLNISFIKSQGVHGHTLAVAEYKFYNKYPDCRPR